VPDQQLVRAFRFRVSLVRSPEVAAGAGSTPLASGGFSASAGAAANVAASASFSAGAGLSGGASFGGGLSAGAGLSAGVSLSAGIGASASASFGASAGIGGGGSAGGGVRLGDGGFAECSGLDIEMDVQELQEGGRNDGVIRRVGRGKYQNLVLKRGMLFAQGGSPNQELWRWLQDVLAGVRPVARYDGIVEVLDVDDVVARWSFRRGLPAKIGGPQLNARTGEIALEELHIAHEGLTMVLS
jgi:phage tail-like protein